MPAKEPIETVQDWIDHVDRLRNKAEKHAHLRLWFRGHARFDWPLQPGVFRNGFPGGGSEHERLKNERHLTQDFQVMSAGLRDPHIDVIALYLLQQHYGMPTRLLDWTNDALAALYFAVSNWREWEYDGAVFMMDAYQFPESDGIATVRRPSVRDAIKIIAEWRKEKTYKDFPPLTFPLRPDRMDVRMNLQRAGFTFHVSDQRELAKSMNETLEKICVAAGSKKRLKEQLAAMGADDFGVYGDLESLSRHLKWAYGIGEQVP